MHTRLVLLPISLIFTALLSYMAYEQINLSRNGIPVEAHVIETMSSLSRMKGGGMSLHLRYDINDQHITNWHILSGFEPFRSQDKIYKMICKPDSPTDCQGELAQPWLTIGMYSFFCLIIWGITLFLWKKRISFE